MVFSTFFFMNSIYTPKILLGFLCLLLSTVLFGQTIRDYNISYIDVSNGLSNNYVRNIIPDEFGFKWIATEGGLNKYDGKTFEVFKPSNTPALENENIEAIFRDSKGNLWVGTKSGGLTFYNARNEEFHNWNDDVFGTSIKDPVRVTTIVEDHEGRIFVGTWANGLYVFHPDQVSDISHYYKQSKINRVIADNYGNVWIAADGKLIKYDPSEDKLIKIGDYGSITGLYHDEERDRLWIGKNHMGLSYLDLSDYTLHETSLSYQSGLSVESLALDNQGRLVVGTWGQGLYISNRTADRFEKYPLLPATQEVNNTSYEAILDIHVDQHNIIWISTAFAGIVKLTPVNSFKNLSKFSDGYSELSDRNIYAISIDSKDQIWMGTYGGGVNLATKNLEKINQLKLPVSKVNVFLEVEEYMLVGAREGLYLVDATRPDQSGKKLFEKLNKITALLMSKEGRLWIGTQQNGLFYVDNAHEKVFNSQPNQVVQWGGGDRISELLTDSYGNVWIGTFNGLFVYDKNQDSFLNSQELWPHTLPSNIINDMYFDDVRNKLWLALSGGLVEMDIQNMGITSSILHGVDNGLKNEFITSVIKGKDDNIWVGTAYGIAKYLPERDVFENYGKSEGIPAYSFNIKSVTTDSEGMLLFGASNGFVAFDPRDMTYEQPAPEVLFTDLKINGQPINVGEEINDHLILPVSLQYTDDIDLTYEEETFSFMISTVDYLGDDNVLFSYRLIGFNDEWSALSSNREIRFINLDPGKYKLEVKASRDNFHWGDVSFKNVNIARPPWAEWYAYTLYVVFVLAISWAINYVANKQAKLQANLEVEQIAREKEHELSEAKITFFTNISHEFRTPLTLIVSPISELLLLQDVKGKVRERLTTMEKNANRLLQLINQLLDYRKSENGLLKLRVANGDFATFSKEVFLSFQSLANSKSIKYKFHSDPKRILLPFDRDKMEIVLVNLLSNAFKYTSKEGSIEFLIGESDGFCNIQVKDSGIGIRKEDVKLVFDRFYQIQSVDSAKVVGSGIGLSLAKNIVALHHGEISVTSTPNEETTFTVRIPIQTANFNDDEYISDFKNSDDRSAYRDLEEEEQKLISSQIIRDEDKETILVVDDNMEIRSYLTSLLYDENYNVISAEDGVQALQLANEEQPDLIISDIMMPEMDGITLCSTIKNDQNTSHIPVILLSARTSTVFEVSGLQTGADDYIKKPFHPVLVKTRVSSILENRRKVREYFVNKLRFEPGEQIEALGSEEKFIQKAISIIEEHIHDAEFKIEDLMDSLAMSQSTLYRKLKSLTGLSITAFIRSVKLKKAAELILTVDWKLNQIAYESGFNDYKYFKTCFQEQFGCLPSQYRSKKTIQT